MPLSEQEYEVNRIQAQIESLYESKANCRYEIRLLDQAISDEFGKLRAMMPTTPQLVKDEKRRNN